VWKINRSVSENANATPVRPWNPDITFPHSQPHKGLSAITVPVPVPSAYPKLVLLVHIRYSGRDPTIAYPPPVITWRGGKKIEGFS
jgi:hypothetical protein